MHIEDRLEKIESQNNRLTALIEHMARQIEELKAKIEPDVEMNTAEAAEYLGLSATYVSKLVFMRAIPVHKKSDKFRSHNIFLKSELDKWKSTRRVRKVLTNAEVRDEAESYCSQNPAIMERAL